MNGWSKLNSAILLIVALSTSQTIDLTGKITNGFGGGPVAGATVKLTVSKLSTLSAADGTYRLHYPNAVHTPIHSGVTLRNCRFKGSSLFLTLTTEGRYSVELFDLKGRCGWKSSGPGSPGREAEIVLPLGKSAGQTGLLRVTIEDQNAFFRYFCFDRKTPLFVRSSAQFTAGGQSTSRAAKTLGTLPVLDTLIASSASFTKNSAIHIFAYNLIDTIDVSLGEQDSFSEARQQIVHRINTYRATLHLKHLVRYAAKEACLDSQAMNDYTTNTAHGAFGRCKEMAQNECPGWGGTTVAAATNSIITGCLQSMWDEGPGTPYSAHGHYINMTDSTRTKTAAGFYWVTSTKKIWSVQDFWP
jgi:hypothetical protein